MTIHTRMVTASIAVLFLFTAAQAALNTPIPTGPTGFVPTSGPSFSWSSVSGATRYRLSLRRLQDDSLHFEITTTGTSFTPTGSRSLQFDSCYKWWVRAESSSQIGPWSSKSVVCYNGSPEVVTLNGSNKVFRTRFPAIRLSGGAAFTQRELRRYGVDALSSPIPAELIESNRTFVAAFESGKVYRLHANGQFHTLARDTQMSVRRNVVAFGAVPVAAGQTPATAPDSRDAIQAAITAASFGQTVFIPEGKWMIRGQSSPVDTRTLNLKSNLNLEGAGKTQTVLVPPTTTFGRNDWNFAAIKGFGLNNVRVSDLQVQGLFDDPSQPVPVNGSLIYSSQANAVIATGSNIELSRLQIEYVQVGLRIFEDIPVSCTTVPVGRSNAILDSTLRFTTQPISMGNVEDSVIAGNTIDQCDSQGILLFLWGPVNDTDPFNGRVRPKGYIRDLIVRDNTITGAQHRGIHLGNLDGGLILDNVIRANPTGNKNMTSGILANGSNLIIMGNRIEDAFFGAVTNSFRPDYQSTGGSGIKLENGPENVLIARNCISGSEADGVSLVAHNRDIVVASNVIDQSGQRGVRVQAGSYFTLGCPAEPTQTCESASPSAPNGFPCNYGSDTRQGRCEDTDVIGVEIVNNAISNTGSISDPNFDPYSYPTFPSSSPSSRTCRKPYSSVRFFDQDTFHTNPPRTAFQYPSLRAHQNVGRWVSLYQSPFHNGRNSKGVPLDPMYGEVKNVFVAFAPTFAPGTLMLDVFSSGVSTRNLAGRTVLISADGTSFTANLESSSPDPFAGYRSRLQQLRSLWESRFGAPSFSDPVRSNYDELVRMINRAGLFGDLPSCGF